MEPERIELSARERDRLKLLHEVEEGHLKQIEAARRLRLSDRQVRRLQMRLRTEGDGGLVHRLRGQRSNRKIQEPVRRRPMRERSQARYRGFGPTLTTEHLAARGISLSRETWRQWMSAAGLWRIRRRNVQQPHVWRPRRSAFGELVMMDSSPYRWLEERGPACHLIALIDDATSRVYGRLVEHDSTEENLRTLQAPAQPLDAHRKLEAAHRLPEILSVRVARAVGSDHTLVWNSQRWGLRRQDVCVGLRGAQAEIERRLDGSHWLRFRGRYLPLLACPAAPRSASPSGRRPPGLADRKPPIQNETQNPLQPASRPPLA
jgi:Helix-turn-helix domain